MSHFNKNDESEAQIQNTSKHLLKSDHDIASNKGKTNGQLPPEYIFGFEEQ